MTQEAHGIVRLIGAGPGDPQLLTVKGQRFLQEADVIVYDRLVARRLLGWTKRGAELIDAGKQHGKGSDANNAAQEQIHTLLIDRARRGKAVVRLKGGDPFVFGRGMEELLALTRAGIPCEVIPGISSAVAVPAYAGIPVTHRGVSSAFTVVTGHRGGNGMEFDLPPDTASQTLVVFMGLTHLSEITGCLMNRGWDAQKPAAVIQCGATSAQRTIVSTLCDIAAEAQSAGLQTPALLIVGDVVKLRRELSWFEARPLLGRKVLVISDTRRQAADFANHLEDSGAETIDIATEEHIRPNVPELVRVCNELLSCRTSGESGQTCSMYFTTRLGIQVFLDHWFTAGHDIRSLHGIKLCATSGNLAGFLGNYGIVAETARSSNDKVWVESPGLHGVSMHVHSAPPTAGRIQLYEMMIDGLNTVFHDSWTQGAQPVVWLTSESAWRFWFELLMRTQYSAPLLLCPTFVLPEMESLAEVLKDHGFSSFVAEDGEQMAKYLFRLPQTG